MTGLIPTSRIDGVRTSARQIVRNLGFMHNHLAGTQLSPSAVHTIIELGYGTVTNASSLGDLLRLEKSSISRLLKKLETGGLVTVQPDPNDRRVRTLGLTPQGTALLRQIEDYARKQLRSAFSQLSAEDLGTVEDGLLTFANALGPNGTKSHATALKLDIQEGYQSELIAQVTGMHANFYSKNYGFGAVFERKVASEMSEFMGRVDNPMNAIFSCYRDTQLLGSVSIDGERLGSNTAQLRWFIVSPEARGLGVGRRLMQKATEFVDETGFQQTRLWTFSGLDAARHLYERTGFFLAEEQPGSQWGVRVTEQEFIRPLRSAELVTTSI